VEIQFKVIGTNNTLYGPCQLMRSAASIRSRRIANVMLEISITFKSESLTTRTMVVDAILSWRPVFRTFREQTPAGFQAPV
jgi:hypothetical protein